LQSLKESGGIIADAPAPAPAPAPEAVPEAVPVVDVSPTRTHAIANHSQPSFSEIVSELGFERDPYDKSKYRLDGKPYALDFDNGRWYDFQQSKGGKGGVSLIQHALDKSFGQAIAWLRSKFGSENVKSSMSEHIDSALPSMATAKRKDVFVKPEKSGFAFGAVRQYLINRGIDHAMIDALHHHGVLYAETKSDATIDDKAQYMRAKQQRTAHDNCVFVMTSPAGEVMLG